ncbi:MAG: hypothetical protein H7263_03435 [Candidatus Sericytochromatia bacterium]|nr:hypothetical protein [Candidatus Sericytochromatia bacterium]
MTGKGKLRFEKLKDHPTEPTGTKVNFRDFSTQGESTLDIKFPSGKKSLKIRYE